MSAEDDVRRLLKEYGAVLMRSNNHNIYKFPDGRIFTMVKTPSDHRTWKNQLQQLHELLGIRREIHKNPNRKSKHGVGKPLYRADPPMVKRRNPLEGFEFRSLAYKYEGCVPVSIERVPITPVWCWMRRLFGYGGKNRW